MPLLTLAMGSTNLYLITAVTAYHQRHYIETYSRFQRLIRRTGRLCRPVLPHPYRELVGGFIEEVVGLVRHKRLLTDIFSRVTARRCDPSKGVHPLDEGGLR